MKAILAILTLDIIISLSVITLIIFWTIKVFKSKWQADDTQEVYDLLEKHKD